jgi:hypothetical protein
MYLKKFKIYNYKDKNYVWNKNDFYNFFDEYLSYKNLLYIKSKKNIMLKYLGRKINNKLIFNWNYNIIYKNYRKHCIIKNYI